MALSQKLFGRNQVENLLKRIVLPKYVINTNTKSTKASSEKRDKSMETCATLITEDCGPCARKHYMDPKCKVALITGGTSGIGYAAAHELLCHGLYVMQFLMLEPANHYITTEYTFGDDIVIVVGKEEGLANNLPMWNRDLRAVLTGNCKHSGKDAVDKLNTLHGKDRACFHLMNVACPKQFEDVFIDTCKIFGGVDILFNNAGVLKDCQWEAEIDTNLKGVINGTLLALQYMSKNSKADRRCGIVINHADVYGLDVLPPAPMYVASKYGVIGATRSFGDPYHYNSTGVRIVGLLSGATDTDLVLGSEDRQYTLQWGKDTFAKLTAKPLQKPSACGRAVVYLVNFSANNELWTIENSMLYKTFIPKRKCFNKTITQL